MALQALIFDVDGTLADTEHVHRLAFNQAFAAHGLPWKWEPQHYRDLLRVTGGKERLLHHIDQLQLDAEHDRRLRSMVPTLHEAKNRRYADILAAGDVRLRPGIERLIAEARSRGCKLAIATTTTATNVDALLRATLGPSGTDLFSVIACGDQVRAKKPAPDIYELALHGLGISCEHAVAFEDSGNGVRAARAAGLQVVATPCYWTRGDDLGDALIELEHLGDPHQPLPGEPGGTLHTAAWLTFAELAQRHDGALRPTAHSRTH